MDTNKHILENLESFCTMLEDQIDKLYENLPTSAEDLIKKNCTALVYQKVIWSLENIMQGRKYNDNGVL